MQTSFHYLWDYGAASSKRYRYRYRCTLSHEDEAMEPSLVHSQPCGSDQIWGRGQSRCHSASSSIKQQKGKGLKLKNPWRERMRAGCAAERRSLDRLGSRKENRLCQPESQKASHEWHFKKKRCLGWETWPWPCNQKGECRARVSESEAPLQSTALLLICPGQGF